MKDFNYDLLIGLLEEYSEMLKIEKVERDKKNSGWKNSRSEYTKRKTSRTECIRGGMRNRT